MYEEQRGPAGRWLLRAARFLSWRAKAVAGVRRRILVEMRWRLGDEIMALPIYGALRAAYPDCRIDVNCSFPELLLDNPHVDSVNAAPAYCDRYLCLRSGPRLVNRLDHYARLAGVARPADPPTLYYRDWTVSLSEPLPRSYAVLAPGASWTTKQWPVEQWQALASGVAAMGLAIVVLGSDGESLGVGRDLTGQTTVRDAACVLHGARLVVSCDSGLMHLARAAGTPVVALFGPTSPAILLRGDAGLYPVTGEAPCQGCWNRTDIVGPNDGVRPGACPRQEALCMRSIAVNDVLERVRGVLEQDGANR